MPPRRALSRGLRLLPVALAAGAVCAQTAPERTAVTGPVEVQAQSIQGRPDANAVAEGQVELRRGPLELQADWLSYEQAQDLARARGSVRLRNPSGRFSGDEVQLQLQRYEGFVERPVYEFDRVQAGGRAARIDFIDRDRSVITQGWYTSCPRGDGERPDWVLQTDRVHIDFARNEGVAEGAVVRFLGVPILALPTMSFPVGEGRKSGWLPPTVDFDTKSGLSLAVPYYWNIAPNRDATLTPRLISRRGLGLDTEFRYLERDFAGTLRADVLPDDRVAGRTRWALWGEHDGRLPWDARWHFDGFRVSDDAWWKDFPKDTRSLTTRLLPTRLEAERDLSGAWGQGQAYARLLRWQVLQASDVTVVSPYERAPQLGARFEGSPAVGALTGLQWQLQTEVNRFVLPDRAGSSSEPTGWRAHAVGSLALPWRQPGAWVVPRLRLNAASYSLDQSLPDGRRQASRLIPGFSVEAGLEFERDTTLQGRSLRQTLEPRVLYVNTPFRNQTGLPNFDSAGKDFNFNSFFSDNAFSGVDRVSDAHHLTAGVTTRLLDAASGAEALRLGVVQRLLLRDQRITPDGVPTTQRFSDIFVLGSASVSSHVAVEGALQYSQNIQRPIRTVASARWSPGEFRTISTTYRYTRGLTEQLDLGWQWPLFSRPVARSGCGGTLYGVGRVSYSKKDSRVTDSIVGVEYDAGCWIARVVAERRSTGLSEATTRVQLQLELVGLSRLGSNALRVLKDNIPGYRLLREERQSTSPAPSLP